MIIEKGRIMRPFLLPTTTTRSIVKSAARSSSLKTKLVLLAEQEMLQLGPKFIESDRR
jgi:hypothetical protein